MIYKCKNCGFLHEGVMPDGYLCPICHSSIFDFELIEEEHKVYNRVKVDPNNPSIQRIEEKCINCGACSKTCENIVGIKYDSSICDGICINCGQCILTCPKGALVPKYNYQEVMALINDQTKKVAVMTSPAVRVGIGDAFDYKEGEFLEGKMVASLKALGFDYVFDTTFGADLTSMEEGHELSERINENNLPMFTSCCPSWVKYISIYHPELIKNLSTCKSPIGMESTIIKEIYAKEESIDLNNFILVALTPCTSKKYENQKTYVDYTITTSELALMIREANIDFKSLDDLSFDEIKGSSSGTIYGTSGGVALSALRVLYNKETGKDLQTNEVLITNKKYFKEIKVKINKKIIKCAVISTMPNLEKFLKEETNYDFIEVMNCDGGCINGGGQIVMPINQKEELKNKRSKSLLKKDNKPLIKYPYKNPLIKDLYENELTEPGTNEILHTKHHNLSKLLSKKED
jgi:ferredoxin hydrogenase